jgi:peptide/nickel transport system permease protein
MYKWYALKRILKGILMYVLLMFTFSMLFNKVAETTLKGQIEEQVRQESQRLRNLSTEVIRNFQMERRQQLYKLHKFDRPWSERVVSRAVDTLTFRFGKSTIIKTQKGERDVIKIIMEALPRSVLLFTTTIAFEIFFGIWLGLKKPRSPRFLDKTTSFITMVVYGLPSWWLG